MKVQPPECLVSVSDARKLGIGNMLSRAEIGARDAVVPSEFVLVPLGPEEAKEKRAGGEHITGSAEEKLAWRRIFAAEIDDSEAAQHHAWSGPAEDGK